MEVRNRFKGLDLIDRVPDELWMEVRDTVQETGIKRGEESQMKWCREPRCSPQVRLVCRGTFVVASRVPSNFSLFNTERGTSLETL